MPAITISAVNTGTDTLTATAHGLLTGDRFRVRNVGGALPTGLAAVTDYFAVRVSADELKVATSSANAMAGTPVVDITGAGSGTNTVEYGLPYCIPTALAVVGTQIKSANDNGVWNALVAIYCLLVGLAQTVWTAVTLAVDLTLTANKHVTVSGTGEFKHGTRTFQVPVSVVGTNAPGASDVTITGTVQAILPLRAGWRLLAIRAVIRDSATGPTKLKMGYFTGVAGNALTQTELGAVSAGDASLQTISRTLAAPPTIASGSVYALQIMYDTGAANCHVYAIEYDVDQVAAA